MEEREELARKIAQLIQRLPPMPDNISRLMAAEIDSRQEYTEVLGLIENDPGLCADLLRLVGDSHCESNEKVKTINDAVQEIGVQPLVQFIGVSYTKQTVQEEFAPLKHLNQYFQHSQEISLSCRIIAEVLDMPKHQREMYSVIGLIHDIGRLVIMLASNRTSVQLMGTSWDEMISIVHNEKEVLGMNHCDVGMQLCSKWNFSPLLNEGVLRHHTPLLDDDFSPLGAVIFVSHFIAISDFTGQMLVDKLPSEFLDRINLSGNAFEKAQDIYNSER
jgi:HD-like signal output (HDOD) protein